MNAELVIEKLRSIGYTIKTDGTDIQLTAEVAPDAEQAKLLLAELRAVKRDAVLLLQGWPPETQTLLNWFLTATMMEAPFTLSAGVRVVNADAFYKALRMDIKRGPAGARARYGVLQADIQHLNNIH